MKLDIYERGQAPAQGFWPSICAEIEMRRRYVEMPDDGLVNFRGRLVTPEVAQAMARRIMGDFDSLSPNERFTWNYAKTSSDFNPSSSTLRYTRRDAKRIAAAGDEALLDELGL